MTWKYEFKHDVKTNNGRRAAEKLLKRLFPLSPPIDCPQCGSPNNSHSGPRPGVRPTAGDVSVCFYCGQMCIYIDETHMRPATAAEERQLARDRGIRRIHKLRDENKQPLEAVLKRWGML